MELKDFVTDFDRDMRIKLGIKSSITNNPIFDTFTVHEIITLLRARYHVVEHYVKDSKQYIICDRVLD